MKIKKLLSQWSTWRGLAVTTASAFGVAPAIVSAGSSVLSAVPAVITAGFGLYDAVRDEDKPKAKAKEQGADSAK